MPVSEQLELERIRYWQGQMLRSRDFRGQMNTDAQLRAWHNRALHQANGVALGLAVSAVPDTGTLTGIRIQPGVAYDCFGRAIILVTEQIVQAPGAPTEASGAMTLLLRYRETDRFPKPQEVAGTCVTCQSSGATESPVFVWKSSDQVVSTDGVSLARVILDNGIAQIDPLFVPDLARPLAKPHLANGATIPGATVWAPWRVGGTGNEMTLGMETVVDTSEAGFTKTPCYFASLQGLDDELKDFKGPTVIFTHIAAPKPDQFTFRVMLPNRAYAIILERLRSLATVYRRENLAYVCWLGCESLGDLSLCLESPATKECCS